MARAYSEDLRGRVLGGGRGWDIGSIGRGAVRSGGRNGRALGGAGSWR